MDVVRSLRMPYPDLEECMSLFKPTAVHALDGLRPKVDLVSEYLLQEEIDGRLRVFCGAASLRGTDDSRLLFSR